MYCPQASRKQQILNPQPIRSPLLLSPKTIDPLNYKFAHSQSELTHRPSPSSVSLVWSFMCEELVDDIGVALGVGQELLDGCLGLNVRET